MFKIQTDDEFNFALTNSFTYLDSIMTSKNFLVLAVLISCVAISFSSTNSNYPTINLANLRNLLESVKPYTDLSNTFYSVKGLELLGEKFQPQTQAVIKKIKFKTFFLNPFQYKKEICNLVKLKIDKNSIESVFFGLSLASSVPNCVVSFI